MADFNAFNVAGKNVVLTGAGGSIGTQITVLFAKHGANLLLSDVSLVALKKLENLLQLHGPCTGRIQYQQCDITSEEQVMSLMQALDPFGGVDVQINNAGVFLPGDGDALCVTQEAWETTLRVNVMGTWLGSKVAIQSMRRHGKRTGSIINVASVAGLIGSATAQIAYTASKGAIIAFTRELAIVHAREGIRFNSLCPGPLNTPLMQDYLGVDADRRFRREIHLPQGRFGEPAEVAGAALFLASDASAFVNAQELVVDGGLTHAYVTPEGPPHKSVLPNFATEVSVIRNSHTEPEGIAKEDSVIPEQAFDIANEPVAFNGKPPTVPDVDSISPGQIVATDRLLASLHNGLTAAEALGTVHQGDESALDQRPAAVEKLLSHGAAGVGTDIVKQIEDRSTLTNAENMPSTVEPLVGSNGTEDIAVG